VDVLALLETFEILQGEDSCKRVCKSACNTVKAGLLLTCESALGVLFVSMQARGEGESPGHFWVHARLPRVFLESGVGLLFGNLERIFLALVDLNQPFKAECDSSATGQTTAVK